MSDTNGDLPVFSPVGERGPQGDVGISGETGQVGQTGALGRTGVPGITGAAGAAGSTGAAGATGVAGIAGTTGETGDRGARGAQGEPGQSFSRTQALAAFVFVVSVFLVLAWRSEHNAMNIERNTHEIVVAQYQTCQDSYRYISVHNAQQVTLIQIDAGDKSIDPGVRAQRQAAYKASIVPLPDCGRAPR